VRRVLHHLRASTRPTGERHPCTCMLAVASAIRAPLTWLLHCVARFLLFAGKRRKTSSPPRRRSHQHHRQPSRQSQQKGFLIYYSAVAVFSLTEGSSCREVVSPKAQIS
jgi:predicted LPLAT superfamily acyltransferase